MDIEYTESEVIGDTRHDYGGFPKALKKGMIIDVRAFNYDESTSVEAFVLTGDIDNIMDYLAYMKPKSEIPLYKGTDSPLKYAQWYRLDIEKMKAEGLLERREYFQFPYRHQEEPA